ncbi:MAG TPA: hypothetical protein VF629_07025 [Hymenobacter sp.]|jgi:hypothetical protein|uniref:hypothetical protein n=1 Tax=Hymenobacter sp. TaxID=1898978 RepID=UPI002ED8C296
MPRFLLLFLAAFVFSGAHAQSQQSPLSVADLNFSVPGLLTVSAWQNQHPNQPYAYPTVHYGFAAGDEVVLAFNTQNSKGLQNLAVVDVATNAVVFSKQAFQNLDNVRFNIPRKAVYAFQFNTNHIMDRSCRLLLQRIPASPELRNFNCNVEWRTEPDTLFRTEMRPVVVSRTFRAETLQEASSYYLNSGSNATLKGGKSRVPIAVHLPANTVRWYYKVSTTRSEADLAQAKAGVNLLVELSRIAALMTLKSDFAAQVVAKGVEQLAQPAGTGYCDVYVLDEQNLAPFLAKTGFRHFPEASRENIQAGAVKVRSFTPGKLYYLGLRNPDATAGESAIVEVGAIVADETTAMRAVKIPVSVGQKRVAYFGI